MCVQIYDKEVQSYGFLEAQNCTYRTRRMNWTLFYVVDKAHMVRWMPVEGVEGRVEFDCVDEFIYGENHLKMNTLEREYVKIIQSVITQAATATHYWDSSFFLWSMEIRWCGYLSNDPCRCNLREWLLLMLELFLFRLSHYITYVWVAKINDYTLTISKFHHVCYFKSKISINSERGHVSTES